MAKDSKRKQIIPTLGNEKKTIAVQRHNFRERERERNEKGTLPSLQDFTQGGVGYSFGGQGCGLLGM
jgi:hypothetical protein